MNTYLECIPCFLRQALEAARMTTDNEKIHTEVLKGVMQHLQAISFESTPPEISKDVHNIIRTITCSNDPYKRVKERSNEMAEKRYNTLKNLVNTSDDPLLTAVKLAIVGNIIDFGTSTRFDIDDMIGKALKKELETDTYHLFVKSIARAKTIVYIADNAGEIFFDKLLLEKLAENHKQITYVVRANPIINDVTLIDAERAEIDVFAEIIAADAGQVTSAPGVLLKHASPDFLARFWNADLVIAKGQGNYESLADCPREIFFSLVVKCPLLAHDIGSEVGSMVLKVER